ncbi:MAG TPA: siderophore-interacting protein [Acidimicrobiales bacterium]
MTTAPDNSSIELAARLGATAAVCDVVSTTQLSSSVHEVVLAGQAGLLAGLPGNDVMIKLNSDTGKLVRRRYSVRSVDERTDQFTLWITGAHEGPGSQWARRARPGEAVDVIGPRGKILLDPLADWHLFLGDVTCLGAAYRMAESIESPGRAIFIVEIDQPDDALTAEFDEGVAVTGIFVDRMGRQKDDPAGLLGGLAAFALPPDAGHAYLFGEFHAMKVANVALLDRGLDESAISLKHFWRAGRGNADHGEPDKSDD